MITGFAGQRIVSDEDGLARYDNDSVHCYVLPSDAIWVDGKLCTASEVFDNLIKG
jgi:hypothetical protein